MRENGWEAWGQVLLGVVLSCALLAAGAWAATDANAAPRSAAAQAAGQSPAKGAEIGKTNARLQRGQTLARASGCGDCHTPKVFDKALGMPVPDLQHQFMGHPEGAPEPGGTLGPQDIALIGPTFTSFRAQFGTVYSSNLTADKETGLGAWSEQDFIRTLRSGKHLGGGRQLLPPMPWMDVAAFSDEELGALFAYLQSVPPQRNKVPAPKVDPQALGGITRSFDQLRAKMSGAPKP